MARSSVRRLGPQYVALVEDLLAEGATVSEITTAVNDALEADGREERVSRSAVGRATVGGLERVLALKRHTDAIADALRREGVPGERREEQIELVRSLVMASSTALTEDGGDALEVRRLAAALLDLEKAGTLGDRRVQEAERRAREDAADRGVAEAKRLGLPDDAVAVIRAAMRGDG